MRDESACGTAVAAVLERFGGIDVLVNNAGITHRSAFAETETDILIVCPGFTATGIATVALGGDGSVTSHPQSTVVALATPESVAEAVFRAAASLLNRLWLALYGRLMARSLRKELARSRGSQ